MDAKGNLYGTTIYGGTSNNGTVYELNKQGRVTMVRSFSGAADGSNPVGAVIRNQNGDLYGTAYQGGSSGLGTVWKLTP